MKAKYYIGILLALVLSGMPVKAQYAGSGYHSNGGPVLASNYYDDYDFYYSSRINRFHRSYVAFDFYSPVFTETYWYSYSPYTWGASIYRGGLGFSYGYDFYYPLYSGFDYYYDYGWSDPFFLSSYYWGYQPYFSYWYTPLIINVGFGNRWDNRYRGWDRHDYNYNSYWGNGYRPDYNHSPSTIYSTRYSTRNSNPAENTGTRYQTRRQEPVSASRPASAPVPATVSRREASTSSSTRVNRARPQVSTSTGNTRTSETRRSSISEPVSRRSSDVSETVRSPERVSAPARSSSDRRESTMSQTRNTKRTESNRTASGSSGSNSNRRK